MSDRPPLPNLDRTWLVKKSLKGAGIDPFKSVMDIEDENVANQLAHKAGKRFDGNYINERRLIEDWLREEAVKKGLNPGATPPLYFRLYEYPVNLTDDKWDTFVVSTSAIPLDTLSFTIEDSFHNYARKMGRHTLDALSNLQPRIFTAEELDSRLREDDDCSDHLAGVESSRYIEAHLWTRHPSIIAQIKKTLAQHSA